MQIVEKPGVGLENVLIPASSVAQTLGLHGKSSIRTVHRYVREGKFGKCFLRVGRKVFFTKEWIVRFVELNQGK